MRQRPGGASQRRTPCRRRAGQVDDLLGIDGDGGIAGSASRAQSSNAAAKPAFSSAQCTRAPRAQRELRHEESVARRRIGGRLHAGSELRQGGGGAAAGEHEAEASRGDRREGHRPHSDGLRRPGTTSSGSSATVSYATPSSLDSRTACGGGARAEARRTGQPDRHRAHVTGSSNDCSIHALDGPSGSRSSARRPAKLPSTRHDQSPRGSTPEPLSGSTRLGSGAPERRGRPIPATNRSAAGSAPHRGQSWYGPATSGNAGS